MSQPANADSWIWMIIMVIGCFLLWIMVLKTGIGRRGIILTLSFPGGGSLCLMEENKIDWWEAGICKHAWYHTGSRCSLIHWSSRLAKCTDFPRERKGFLPVLHLKWRPLFKVYQIPWWVGTSWLTYKLVRNGASLSSSPSLKGYVWLPIVLYRGKAKEPWPSLDVWGELCPQNAECFLYLFFL